MSDHQVIRHDPDAEAVVLSACMMSAEALDECLPILEKDDFAVAQNRRIWGAITDLAAAGESVDVVAVTGRLREKGELELIGGTPYVATLVDMTPTLAHPEQKARTVRNHAQARRAVALFQKLAAKARTVECDAVTDFLGQSEAEIFQLAGDRADDSETASAYSEIAREATTRVETANRTGTPGVPTGFIRLDQHLGGMVLKKLWYVAGRTGMGKTSFVMQAIENAAELGWGVVVFSLEMERVELMLRSVARRTSIRYTMLEAGRLTPNQWAAFADALSGTGERPGLSQLPIIVDETPMLTPGKLRSRLRRHIATLQKRHPDIQVKVCVVDHVQLMDSDGKEENRNAAISTISRSLKQIAKSFDVCMVVASQVNRPPKTQRAVRPQLDDLRESGSLEQDADVVLFVHRPDKYREPEDWDYIAELFVAKGRNYGEGIHRCRWKGECFAFSELEEGDDPGENVYQQEMYP